MSRSILRNALRNAVVVAMAMVIGVPLSELLLRLVLRSPSGYRALPPGLEATFRTQFVHGVQGPALYKVNSMGVRGREWSKDRRSEYRVLCVGGSTTECIVIDQSRVWTTLLEQKLAPTPDGRRPWVGNIGRSGLSTRSHVLQMRHLLDVYDPDCIVVLAGVNDLSGRLRQGDGYDPSFAERPENREALMRQAFAVAPGQFASEWRQDPWFKRTRLWLLLRLARYQILKIPEEQDTEGLYLTRWRELRARGRRTSVLPPLDAALQEYAGNLREIVRLGRGHRSRLILITQPVLWRPNMTDEEKGLLWMGGVGDFRVHTGSLYYEPEALARGMDAYNDKLREVCRETGVECIDLAAVVPKTVEYFYDDCHFTDEAQILIADTVARAIHVPAGEPSGDPPAAGYQR